MNVAELTIRSSGAAPARALSPSARATTVDAKLKEAAGEVVGQIFFAPLLAQMRRSSLEGEFGHGGRGEEVFGAQLDSLLAGEIGRSKQSPIAEVIWQRYRGQQQAISGMKSSEGREWAA